MPEDIINSKAFALVSKLEITKIPPRPNLNQKHETLMGIGEPLELKQTFEPIIRFQEDSYKNTISIFSDVGDTRVGFNENTYHVLRSLAEEIIQLDYFSKYSDLKFLERKIFDWIIKIYRNGKAEFTLINFLKLEIEKELSEYTFYFKVYSLGIHKEIVIGKVQFTGLTKDFFVSKFHKIKAVGDQKAFEGIYDEYTRSVVGITSVYATKDKAESLAYKKVQLALNSFKCCMIIDSLTSTTKMPHLNQSSNNGKSISFMSSSEKNDGIPIFKSIYDGSPVEITKSKWEIILQIGLNSISDFLQNERDNELYVMTTWKINALGEIFSVPNLHNRTVELISFFESFLIPPDNLKAKGEARIKTLIKYYNLTYEIELFQCIRKMYEIRDRFLHNRIELHVDIEDLWKFQSFAILFVLELIKFNDKYTSMNDVLNEIFKTK